MPGERLGDTALGLGGLATGLCGSMCARTWWPRTTFAAGWVPAGG